MLGIQQVNPGALCEEYMGLTSISSYKMNTEPMLIRPIEKKIQRVVQMHENCVPKLAKLDMEGFFSPFAQKRR